MRAESGPGLLRAVEAHDEGDLIEEGDGQKGQLNSLVSDQYRDQAHDQTYCDSDRIFHAEGMKVGRALQAGCR